MLPQTAALVLALGLATSAQAAVDFTATESGLDGMSGGRPQFESYGLSGLILEFNNYLGYTGYPMTEATGDVDASIGTDGNEPLSVGYLIFGENGTRYTYDRLAVNPVLQLIGFDQSEPKGIEVPRTVPAEDNVPFVPPPLPLQDSQGSDAPNQDVPIPEPASAAAFLAAGLLLLRRPRRPRV